MNTASVIEFGKKLGANIQQSDDGGLAAEMAYHLMLSLLPALVFAVSLFDLLGTRFNWLDDVMGLLYQVAPKQIVPLLHDTVVQIVQADSGGFAIAGFLGLLWTASNGAAVVVKSLTRAFDIPVGKQSIVKERLLAIGVILVTATGLLLGLNLLFFGNAGIAWLANQLDLSGWVTGLLNVFRLVVVLVLLVGFSAFLYAIALYQLKPRISWKETIPGALTFVGLWLLMSYGFSLYVENMGDYNRVYGALGVVVVLMIWLYLSSFALLIGGEINSVIHQKRQARKEQQALGSAQRSQPA